MKTLYLVAFATGIIANCQAQNISEADKATKIEAMKKAGFNNPDSTFNALYNKPVKEVTVGITTPPEVAPTEADINARAAQIKLMQEKANKSNQPIVANKTNYVDAAFVLEKTFEITAAKDIVLKTPIYINFLNGRNTITEADAVFMFNPIFADNNFTINNVTYVNDNALFVSNETRFLYLDRIVFFVNENNGTFTLRDMDNNIYYTLKQK